MEMNGRSSASYLASTSCDPLSCTSFKRGGNRRAFRLPSHYQANAGITSIVRLNLGPVIIGFE